MSSDLASRLRPEPRNFDALFYVNVGALVVFFALFGSHFVLAPGMAVNFRLPTADGGEVGARIPTHVISVLATGQIFTSHGDRKLEQLPAYFATLTRGVEAPVLLVRADAAVPTSVMATISSSAQGAGFEVLWAVGEPRDARGGGGR